MYVDIKNKLHKDRHTMEEEKENITDQLMKMDNNIQILEKRNEHLQTTLKAQSDMGGLSGDSLTTESLDKIVTVPDPISEKIIHLVAKTKALEDCMLGVKKGYEKDVITVQDFLKEVRLLSNKQCKQIIKMRKINEFMNKSQKQFSGYAM